MAQVSVIIPTYNRRAFVLEAIQSVLIQTYRSFELIVVDDGSEDNTRAALRPMALAGRVTYLHQANRGVSAARNAGLARAGGSLIAFLDSDDLWQPQKLARQVAFMDAHPDAMICYTDEIWIRNGRRVNPMKKHAKHGGWVFEPSLALCIISPSSVLIRRELFDDVGTFDEGLPVCEDYDLWVRIAARYPVHWIPEKLIIKRGGHDDQLSRRWGNDVYRVRALLKAWESPGLSAAQRELVARHLAEKSRILAQGYRRHGRPAEAEYYEACRGRFGGGGPSEQGSQITEGAQDGHPLG